MNYGNKVILRMIKNTAILRNVTEIHWNYSRHPAEQMVAFESDIHKTGLTLHMSNVIEFETRLETQKENNFD